MKRTFVPLLLVGAAALAGCASGPPPAAEFPAGARTPSAAEITTALRGKSFTAATSRGTGFRIDHGATDGMRSYFDGRTDDGTWRAEDGRVCYQFRVITSACNEVRMAGNDIYLKRSNGEVVRLMPR